MRIDFQSFLPRSYDGRAFDTDAMIRLADEAGVDRFVAMPEPEERPDNAGLAERVRDNPRVIGCAGVNPRLGSEAVDELERAAQAFRFRGIKLSPMAHGYPADDGIVNPVIGTARALGLPVTVEGDGPLCTPAHIEGLAGRFPDVPFIVDLGFRPHVTPGGTGAILDAARHCPNLVLGFTALTASEPHHLQTVVAAIGPERVVFGSHAPWGIPSFAVGGIQRAGLGEKAEALIFGGTLARVYRL